MLDINFELYKVFYYVATTLSFSEASKRLYISQSAVSQSIKLLESGQLRIGLGVAYIPEYCVPTDDPDLYCILIVEDIPERKIVTAYNKNTPLSVAAKRFLDLLKEDVPSPESL